VAVDVRGSSVQIGERADPASLVPVPGTPLYHLVWGTRSAEVIVLQQSDGWLVGRGGETWVVEVRDEARLQARALTGSGPRRDGAELVRAPMPGLVLRVEVEPGQTVVPGSGLVVLEAMKMENEIRAPVSGRVKAVLVKAGQTVEKGSVLLELSLEG